MKRYQKVKNEWGETEDFIKEVSDERVNIDGSDYSKHITPDNYGDPTNEPTLKGALTLVIILYLIGFASCYGLFWAGFLHV